MTATAAPLSSRFRDRRYAAYDFTDAVPVRCPGCDGIALPVPAPDGSEAVSRGYATDRHRAGP
ncbi:hypothetical protein [Streptomyces sp. Wb2n-11]|uniref:hypothetical protein n=1 Tax=Streptomyces sp. Wb2n-11 TaxID=1030533 RepID=UPI000AC970A3|nr:hypothetical protein [Streptomyces sp. Wb2n-11]